MSLGKTWYRVERAADKFGVTTEQIREWIADALLRTELSEEGEVLVNGDDLTLQVEGLVSEMHDAGDRPEVSI